MNIRNLEPKELWGYFSDLNAVPRGSKKEAEVVEFMMDFGRSLGLETTKDSIDNVIIKKPASKGYEDRKTVILQSHLDMVHQKNNDTVFDFDTEGIRMIVDGDWVKADGTTLGADNGIGVATIMAVLASDSIVHPPIEAMFTIDEETGMTGAKQLDPTNFSGEILLNLDTEDDDELSIGCAGGIDTNTFYSYKTENATGNLIEITVKGLLGGHSGMDIDRGRANANKLLNRVLKHIGEQFDIRLHSFDGGGLRNAIPREASAGLIVLNAEDKKVLDCFEEIRSAIIAEYNSIEVSIVIEANIIGDSSCEVATSLETNKMISSIFAVYNGVFRLSPDIEGLVEASSSLARVLIKDGDFQTQSLQRSSVESSKKAVANTVRAPFDLLGANVIQDGDYPGWRPNSSSEILELMSGLYKEKYKQEPQIKACHAGLECGILMQHLPQVDMISFGPNIRGAHSPDEKVQISSVQKFWSYFLDALERIPVKLKK